MRQKKFRRGFGARVEPLENRNLFSVGIGSFSPAGATWSLRSTPTPGPADVGTFQFGAPLPVVGDWNGDGHDDIGTFNIFSATWSLRYGTSAGAPDAGIFVFGKRGSLPVVGDWNGDGRDDIGVYDPHDAKWSLRLGASAGPANAGTFSFGSKKSVPVAGDWDGDGKDGIGTFDLDSAKWTLRQTADGGAANAGNFKFGNKKNLPIVGDWNGDKKDGIGTVDPVTATWTLRQTASAGAADAGTFNFGTPYMIPVAGDFAGLAAAESSTTLSTITLKPLDLDLLGLKVQSSPITVSISAKSGNGELLGNLFSSASNLVSTKEVNQALNNVLGTAVDLVNSTDLSVGGVTPGAFDNATASTTQVLELFVAPIHLDMVGAQIDVSPVRLSVSATAGQGLVLGNALLALSNLFNPPLPSQLNVGDINTRLTQLLSNLNAQLPGIAPASYPTPSSTAGDVLAFTVPAINLDLLGLRLQTDPVTVDANVHSGNGRLLGNVWTTTLNSLGSTPAELSTLSSNVTKVLAKVVGALNASTLTLSAGAISGLTPALQALTQPTLINPTLGASTPVLDLVLASPGSTPPTTVDLLGLSVASNNVNAKLLAHTGDGQILGNLLYNAVNLANPNGSASLNKLRQLIASGSTAPVGAITGGLPATAPSSSQLYKVTLPPLDLNLLGFQVQTDPITVTLTAQRGNGELLGNALRSFAVLLNVNGVSGALNSALATAANLVNSVSFSVPGVGSGSLDTAAASDTPILDTTVAPLYLDLAGAQVQTSPIHLKMTAHSGDGLVLGNVLAAMANLFNPPLPTQLNLTDINARLQQLLTNLNAQVPDVAAAPMPQNVANVLGVTVPGIDLNLLGLKLKTDAITVGADASTGNGLLLGNVLTTLLNTLGTSAPSGISQNVNALLAKVVGVFNASTMTLPAAALDALPSVFQTLASPTLTNPTAGATASILDLGLAAANGTARRTGAGLLGAAGTTSSVHVQLSAQTGDGQVLGNILYNVANLLNSGSSSSDYLLLLDLLNA
jgi:hypothetical protein